MSLSSWCNYVGGGGGDLGIVELRGPGDGDYGCGHERDEARCDAVEIGCALLELLTKETMLMRVRRLKKIAQSNGGDDSWWRRTRKKKKRRRRWK